MEETGLHPSFDTRDEIQKAGIILPIMTQRALAIWVDPFLSSLFVYRTPDGMLAPPEWVEEPSSEQDTVRENLIDAESARAKEATAKRGGPPKTTGETDSCTHGLLLRADAQRKNKKLSVTQLAKTMGVTRQSLYENRDFAPVRDMANKLFGLFEREAKRGEWQGPRGTKNKDGTIEAEDPADNSDD